MKTWGSAASVVAAIREDAAAERDRLEREMTAAIESLRSGDRQSAPADAEDRLARIRLALAEREGNEEWEEARRAIRDREEWITRVTTLARQALGDAADGSAADWMAALVREAVPQLPGSAFVVAVPAAFAAILTAGWRIRLEEDLEIRLTIEFDGPPAGCLLRTPDGRVTFDNSIAAREQRTARVWRPLLAKMYDAATSQASLDGMAPAVAGCAAAETV